MFVGVSFIARNSQCTHIIKIRTDQLLPIGFIDWLDNFFATETPNTKKIVCSEMLQHQAFYVGDFVFAGKIEQVFFFTDSVLRYNGKRIALNNSVDYVLKYLMQTDKQSLNKILSDSLVRNEITFLRRHSKVKSLWGEIAREYFSVLPEDIYHKILWRDRPMADIFSDNIPTFIFYKDLKIGNHVTDLNRLSDGAKESYFKLLKRMYIELKRYLRTKIKYYTTSQ